VITAMWCIVQRCSRLEVRCAAD